MRELNQLMKDNGRRGITQSKMGLILSDMGYSEWGRAPKPVIPHLQMPMLWYKGDVSTVSFDDCKAAMGWH